jgi:hypothetical protein
MDYELVKEFECSALKQEEFGSVEIDNLWNDRDVATQITSQLITGKDWRETGVTGRKKYTNRCVEWLEKRFFRKYSKYIPLEITTRGLRKWIYNMHWTPGEGFEKRNYLKSDLKTETLFEEVENSEAVYVPAYNPEPSWAIRRNILNPEKYPELGFDGARDLAEKNFFWRKKKIKESLEGEKYDLFMAQVQYIDSLQHLYLVYSDKRKMDELEKAYGRMENFVEELKEGVSEFDIVLLISDNGAAKNGGDYTHHLRPAYSISMVQGVDRTNMRDFYGHIKKWLRSNPNPIDLK